LGGNFALWAIGARFPGVGNPLCLKLSELRFWLEGHKIMIKEEGGNK